jgi:hypothetical protein
MVLKHYGFNVWHEDAEALLIRAVKRITKQTTYSLQYSIEIKEKQISVLANVTESGSGAGVLGGTVFGKAVTKEPRASATWHFEKELEGARWLIGKVIRTIGRRLDATEFKSQTKR